MANIRYDVYIPNRAAKRLSVRPKIVGIGRAYEKAKDASTIRDACLGPPGRGKRFLHAQSARRNGMSANSVMNIRERFIINAMGSVFADAPRTERPKVILDATVEALTQTLIAWAPKNATH